MTVQLNLVVNVHTVVRKKEHLLLFVQLLQKLTNLDENSRKQSSGYADSIYLSKFMCIS